MSSHPFYWIDVFTEQRFAGNPCAVVFAADDLQASTMQTVAREMNLSETAFVMQSTRADIRARYFTPVEELPMAGHPTLATVFALRQAGVIDTMTQSLNLELKAGVVGIEISGTESPLITMQQNQPEFLSQHAPDAIAPLFGLEVADLIDHVVPQTISTGTPQLMVPVKDKTCLDKAQLNVAKYLAYKASSDFFSPHLFCVQDLPNESTSLARHFGVPPDTLEDPFTGSATGAMAAFLWRYGLINKPNFVAEQGHWLARPGRTQVEVLGEVKGSSRHLTQVENELDEFAVLATKIKSKPSLQ